MMFGLAVVCPGNSERFKTKLINNQNLPAIQATGQDITFCNIFSCFLEQMVIQFSHPNSSKMGIGTLCLTVWYLHKTFTWYINRLHLQPQLANVQLRSIHVNKHPPTIPFPKLCMKQQEAYGRSENKIPENITTMKDNSWSRTSPLPAASQIKAL